MNSDFALSIWIYFIIVIIDLIVIIIYMIDPISFPEHARSQVKGGHSYGEIELIHVEFPT